MLVLNSTKWGAIKSFCVFVGSMSKKNNKENILRIKKEIENVYYWQLKGSIEKEKELLTKVRKSCILKILIFLAS